MISLGKIVTLTSAFYLKMVERNCYNTKESFSRVEHIYCFLYNQSFKEIIKPKFGGYISELMKQKLEYCHSTKLNYVIDINVFIFDSESCPFKTDGKKC